MSKKTKNILIILVVVVVVAAIAILPGGGKYFKGQVGGTALTKGQLASMIVDKLEELRGEKIKTNLLKDCGPDLINTNHPFEGDYCFLEMNQYMYPDPGSNHADLDSPVTRFDVVLFMVNSFMGILNSPPQDATTPYIDIDGVSFYYTDMHSYVLVMYYNNILTDTLSSDDRFYPQTLANTLTVNEWFSNIPPESIPTLPSPRILSEPIEPFAEPSFQFK